MIRFGAMIIGVILLGACCGTPERTVEPAPGWVEFISTAQPYSDAQMQDALKAASLRYQMKPDDESRIKLAWLLSQGNPSLQQLDRSLGLTREISSAGAWAAQRNLLQQDVQNMIELLNTRSKVLELQTQLETKSNRLEEVEAQLKAMKDIETRMTEEFDPDLNEPK